jgi:N-acetylglucosaminyl-diphospho-decaprenol L-rhamnosyltransferase
MGSGGAAPEEALMPVDVGVVTYNTRDMTLAALRRLHDVEHGCEIRVLVHDNASTDGTAAAIAAELPDVDVGAGDANTGFAAGMNRLLARSDAPWFLALNSDAWPEPGAIGALVAAGDAWPRAAAVAPRIERPDGSLEHSTHPFPSARLAALLTVSGGHWLPRRVQDDLMLVGGWAHDRPRDVDWAVGAALLMRRAAIDEVGGFDERFFMYAEDLEWCWRARRGGWTIRFEPAALVRHVGNASGASVYGGARTAAYMRNTYRFYRREHGPAATAFYRGLNLAAASGAWAAARLARRPGKAAWWADQVRSHLVRTGGGDGPPERSP